MKRSEVLKAARELIADEKHWTQGAFARDKDGKGLLASDICSPEAFSFCARGALARVLNWNPHDHRYAQKESELTRLIVRAANGNDICNTTVSDWNDSSPHEVVLAGFDAAIRLAEEEEAANGGE